MPGEDQLHWIAYRGSMSRRTVADTPMADAVVCILEAAARNPGPRREALFRQALEHPDRNVRWTAARLGARLVPEALQGIDPNEEMDPLVKARLERAADQGQ